MDRAGVADSRSAGTEPQAHGERRGHAAGQHCAHDLECARAGELSLADSHPASGRRDRYRHADWRRHGARDFPEARRQGRSHGRGRRRAREPRRGREALVLRSNEEEGFMSIRNVVALAVALIAAPALAQEKVTYNMAWLPQGSSIGVIVAEDRGYFRELG